MTSLERALRSDAALARLEDHLILQARKLYEAGFGPETPRPSQMAAVAETLRMAEDHGKAVADLHTWMESQLEKLRKREERDGRRSWLVDAQGGEPGESLGQALVRWLRDEVYLPDETDADLDHLAALRRFWGRLHGLHRYHVEIGETMPLKEVG